MDSLPLSSVAVIYGQSSFLFSSCDLWTVFLSPLRSCDLWTDLWFAPHNCWNIKIAHIAHLSAGSCWWWQCSAGYSLPQPTHPANINQPPLSWACMYNLYLCNMHLMHNSDLSTQLNFSESVEMSSVNLFLCKVQVTTHVPLLMSWFVSLFHTDFIWNDIDESNGHYFIWQLNHFQCQAVSEDWSLWIVALPRVQGFFGKDLTIPSLHLLIFFILFNSNHTSVTVLDPDQSTVAQQVETTAAEYSLASCLWAHFPDTFSYHCTGSAVSSLQ